MAATPASALEQQPPPSHHQHQGLPSISSLTQSMYSEQAPATESSRDSGTWPQPHSKHTSANSGLHVSTLLNPDDSPARTSIPSTPLSARLSAGSGAPGSGLLPSINQGFQEPGNRDSHASIESRRSSVDSRMHQGFTSLYINNPTSPYESANTSQVSLAASLRRPNGQAPMSPLGLRSGMRHPPGPRVAPPIMPGRTPGQPDPTAPKPTQGFAWAFPDTVPEESRRGSNSDESSIDRDPLSRTNSFAASVRSSIFSNDSQLPVGQRRFENEHATTHHHTMQHRAVQNLQSSESIAPQSAGNYSRTPELRVSHKLAERKRRSEMKDLFEDLNKAVPSNGGTKASKWEILSKAIDHIKTTQQNEMRLQHELNQLRRDSEFTRDTAKENELLKTEIQIMQQHLRRLEPNNAHVYGTYSHSITNQGPAAHPPQTNGTSGISLPPLNPSGSSNGQHANQHSGFGGSAPAAAMQGVEYNGYNAR